jgi:hypothetical protein
MSEGGREETTERKRRKKKRKIEKNAQMRWRKNERNENNEMRTVRKETFGLWRKEQDGRETERKQEGPSRGGKGQSSRRGSDREGKELLRPTPRYYWRWRQQRKECCNAASRSLALSLCWVRAGKSGVQGGDFGERRKREGTRGG